MNGTYWAVGFVIVGCFLTGFIVGINWAEPPSYSNTIKTHAKSLTDDELAAWYSAIKERWKQGAPFDDISVRNAIRYEYERRNAQASRDKFFENRMPPP